MVSNTINGLSVLQSERLLAAGVPHGWFDSSLGNTIFRSDNPFRDSDWIDESAMQQRRSKACSALGLDDSRVVVASGLLQTGIVQVVDDADAGKKVGPADGYVTNTPMMPILLAAGDCAQIIVYDPNANALAVVHAGGLATARGILTNAIKRLIDELGADPRHMIAAIGPSLSPEHFVPTQEVDNFTLADIASTNPVTKKLADGRTGYDVAATNVRQLLNAGIPKSQIDVSVIDTFTRPEWYSYERDHEHDLPAAMRRHGLFVACPQKQDLTKTG